MRSIDLSMASDEGLSRGGENAIRLEDMAAQLLVILSAHRDAPKPWDELHGMLAQVATWVADPRITVKDLEGPPEGGRGPSSLPLGHPEAEALLQRIMESLREEVRALDAGTAIPRFRELLLVVASKLDMLPLRDSDPLHIVNGDSNFCDTNVASIIMCSPELSAPSAHYAVVSIVGAQSSGKSYLLNRLFGTKFPEMDARLGRSQTTKGIMMSRCVGPSLLVLDVEGFDGREKGQDTLFENQAALFALTVSDVMLVNINVFDIGREKAGGTLLFETIFQERTKLPPGLTNIIVVLRMYDRETPLILLKDDVMKNMEKMWKNANKKEYLKFEDYIKVDVVGLPDKNSKYFPEEVASLRRLLSKSSINHNGSAKVPASSFSLSSRRFWEKIKNNEELDIPSHKETLARLFCRRSGENALNLDSREDYKKLKAEESPRRFKEIADTILESVITMYDHETEKYDPKIRDNERQYMVEKLRKVFLEVSRELIRKMVGNASDNFKGEYVKIFKNMEENDDELEYDDHMVHSCIEEFMKLCEALKEFDSDYVHMKCGELEKQLQLYNIHQILTIKEIRAKKATKLAQESDKNLEEVLKKLDETVKERKQAEDEMMRLKEKQLKDELKYAQKMLAEQLKHADRILADKQEREEKILAVQKENMEKIFADKEVWNDKMIAGQKEQMENMLAAQNKQMEKMMAKKQEEAEKMLAVQNEQMEKMLALQQLQIAKKPVYQFSLWPWSWRW